MKKINVFKTVIVVFLLSFITSCEKHECKCDCEDWQSQVPEGTFCYADEGRQKEMLNYTEIITMLTNYDQTRIRPLEDALGYEDSRINTYNYEQFKKYLGHIEYMSKKAKINITGISFIATANPNYKGTGKSYQDLIYIPTTTIDGKDIAFDPVQSVKQGKLVTFKQMLAVNGYKWIYNTKKEFEEGKRKDYNYTLKKENKAGFMNFNQSDVDESGAGNWGNLEPPYAN